MKRYLPERGSERVLNLFHRQADIGVSRISYAEVCSGLARAWRATRLDDGAFEHSLNQMTKDFGVARVVEVRRPLIEATRELIVRWPLRGYDAVQLACARKFVLEGAALDFWCADLNLAAAARGEGLRATLID